MHQPVAEPQKKQAHIQAREAVLQGFIEGRYVPLAEGESVTASMDIVEAESADAAATLAAMAEAEAKAAQSLGIQGM